MNTDIPEFGTTSYQGYGARFDVDATTITKVNRAVVGAVFGAGDRVPLSQVLGYHFKPATRLANGYLQLAVAGVPAGKAEPGDAHTVVFTRRMQPRFEQLRDWLKEVAEVNRAATSGPAVRPEPPHNPVLDVRDLEIAGESHHRDSFSQLFARADKPLGGVIWRDAELVAEPWNPHDTNAVAVYIDMLSVGYVPAEVAPAIQATVLQLMERGQRATVEARIWAIYEHGTWSARVTLEPGGDREPEWRYVDRPTWPGRISPDGTERLSDAAVLRRLDEAADAALVDGREFTSLRTDIAQARADGDTDRALVLLHACIDAAERSAAILVSRPATWPTEQAAIIYRSRKQYDDEVMILERFLRDDPEHLGTKGLRDRLERARELAGTVRATPEPAAPVRHEIIDPGDSYLTALRPADEIVLPRAAELSYEKDHIEAIDTILDDANIPRGRAHHTTAIVRELDHGPQGWGPLAVYVDRRLVGYVSALEAEMVREVIRHPQHHGHDCAVRCRIFVPAGTRAPARIILGPYEQAYDAEDETESSARARMHAAELADTRRTRLAAGGSTAEDQRRRLVRGRDFVEWAEEVKQLKRAQHNGEALRLVLECVDAAERDARFHGYSPAPWYTEQAAILYRKAGDVGAEIAILERYLRACRPDQIDTDMAERLVKAQALAP
ncbi:hypothetical protein GYA93_16050 [Gordonia desulfuricans]|uniref:HIRAN domain-containing protein n=1 Tax=Gordonia desulfuricans TaxID=89051 RepID=A0A7K3LSA3_9ACTN|nr:hypothetical protein [Gordonia desulfuricans]NDK91082.1 hypothetical protein [Gordonia desulfuricans]